MVYILAVAVGGALGAVLRYLVVIGMSNISLIGMPTGVLSCNILGSFLLGILISWSMKDPLISENLRIFLQVGILGAFTTFSTFALEVLNMTEKGDYTVAMIYVVLSVIFSIGGLFLGISFYRLLA